MKHIAVVVACIAAFVGGLGLSWFVGDCSHAMRAGALMVGIVVLVEGWLLLATSTPDKMPFWKSPESHRAARIAVIFVFLGTLAQGYGDLVAKGLHLCH